MSTTRRIHRPIVVCALACGLLAAPSGAAARATQPSQRTADITAAELAGNLAHERTADITAAELAGRLIHPSRRLRQQEKQILASRGVGAGAPVTHARVLRVGSSATGLERSHARTDGPNGRDTTNWRAGVAPRERRYVEALSSLSFAQLAAAFGTVVPGDTPTT